MQIKYIPPPLTRPSGLLRKTAAAIVTIALVGVALMFSAILLAVILVVVVFGGAYLWWKTRELRRLMQNIPPPQSAATQSDVFAGEVFEGEVIEGEVIRVDESPAQGGSIEFDQAKRQPSAGPGKSSK